MARSVVKRPSIRCAACQLPPRWCICAVQSKIELPFPLSLLSHQRELGKPSSTGNLIKRLLPATDQHVWDPALPLREADLADHWRELLILHPQGEPLPTSVETNTTRFVLIDAAWHESVVMLRQVKHWGRPVRLAMTGESRFWLRNQQGAAQFSTIEALIFLCRALGFDALCAELQLQLELHVYAGLRSRGNKEAANQ
jgi:DTW domain-containing protein